MRIKKFISNIDLTGGEVYLADPVNDCFDKAENQYKIDVLPGTYKAYVVQDYENNPMELQIVHEAVFNWVSDDREIIFSDYFNSKHSDGYVGLFENKFSLKDDDFNDMLTFLGTHTDNNYHDNKPWFNTFLFRKNRGDLFEGIFLKTKVGDFPIYVMKNKYKKIIALKFMVM